VLESTHESERITTQEPTWGDKQMTSKWKSRHVYLQLWQHAWHTWPDHHDHIKQAIQ